MRSQEEQKILHEDQGMVQDEIKRFTILEQKILNEKEDKKMENFTIDEQQKILEENVKNNIENTKNPKKQITNIVGLMKNIRKKIKKEGQILQGRKQILENAKQQEKQEMKIINTFLEKRNKLIKEIEGSKSAFFAKLEHNNGEESGVIIIDQKGFPKFVKYQQIDNHLILYFNTEYTEVVNGEKKEVNIFNKQNKYDLYKSYNLFINNKFINNPKKDNNKEYDDTFYYYILKNGKPILSINDKTINDKENVLKTITKELYYITQDGQKNIYLENDNFLENYSVEEVNFDCNFIKNIKNGNKKIEIKLKDKDICLINCCKNQVIKEHIEALLKEMESAIQKELKNINFNDFTDDELKSVCVNISNELNYNILKIPFNYINNNNNYLIRKKFSKIENIINYYSEKIMFFRLNEKVANLSDNSLIRKEDIDIIRKKHNKKYITIGEFCEFLKNNNIKQTQQRQKINKIMFCIKNRCLEYLLEDEDLKKIWRYIVKKYNMKGDFFNFVNNTNNTLATYKIGLAEIYNEFYLDTFQTYNIEKKQLKMDNGELLYCVNFNDNYEIKNLIVENKKTKQKAFIDANYDINFKIKSGKEKGNVITKKLKDCTLLHNDGLFLGDVQKLTQELYDKIVDDFEDFKKIEKEQNIKIYLPKRLNDNCKETKNEKEFNFYNGIININKNDGKITRVKYNNFIKNDKNKKTIKLKGNLNNNLNKDKEEEITKKVKESMQKYYKDKEEKEKFLKSMQQYRINREYEMYKLNNRIKFLPKIIVNKPKKTKFYLANKNKGNAIK